MVIAAPALPDIDEHMLDDQFYRLADMAPAHMELLNKAESKIKNFLLKSHKAAVAELQRVEDRVPRSLFKEWCQARFGWSPETVQHIRAAVPQAQAHLDTVKAQRNQLAMEMRASGMTQQQTADALGVSRERVAQVEGSQCKPPTILTPPSKGAPVKLTPEQQQEIVEALAGGAQVKQLAQRYGCAPSTIKRAKQRVGLAPPALPDQPTEGSTVAHSPSNHSPSLTRLRTPGTPEALAMEDHKAQFFKAIGMLIQDISKAEKRLGTLQKEIQEDFTRYHGAMLARWAAYEQVWASEMFDVCGCETFDEVKQTLTGRIRKLEAKARQSLATLDRIQSTTITIEA